ncbi:hypothetical protein [Kribbella shirazensis]|uniref:Uncharacterized protein n=1 Tax=Kribbella shirazensis TaxID=1105143 RepID=A0A7X5V942_9ACTN|nr:hypothetical protein [Kribbella shirazensis]NIK56935.1 hypothetical protein [Kribbella shirazensis]
MSHLRGLRSGVGRVLVCWLLVGLAGCGAVPERAGEADGNRAPERFRIVPDDYHVPYAGTAADGRKFFLSDELFVPGSGTAYVGLFLWNADGTFAELKVDEVRRPEGLPPAQAASAGADQLVAARLAELGKYVLEPIDVAPFTVNRNGVTFGWAVTQFEGTYSINIEPGNFIAYYEPWDGLEYDT